MSQTPQINPIIQNYLNDESIDPNKRRNVFNALESGEADPIELASQITARSGDKYVPQPRDLGDGERPASSFLPGDKMGDYTVRGPDLGDRVKNTFVKAWEGAVEGGKGINVGLENRRGANQMEDLVAHNLDRINEQLASGEITQEKHDEIKELLKGGMEQANDLRDLGNSEIFRHSTRIVGSPMEGVVVGGFEPEVQKVGEYLSENETFKDAVGDWEEFAEKHPVAANYLVGGVELLGMKGGAKAAGEVADAAGTAATAAARTIDNVGTNVLKNTPGAINKITDWGSSTFKRGSDALSSLGDGFKGFNKMDPQKYADELLSPLATTKNLRKGAEKGLSDLGSKGLFSSTKATIGLSERMKQASATLVRVVEDLTGKKLTKFKLQDLPVTIQEAISNIAEPLKNTFKKIKMPEKIKEGVLDSWISLKQTQLEDIFYNPGTKRVHGKFDDILEKVIFKEGVSINDFWDGVKAFDKSVGKRIAEVLEMGGSDSAIAMHKSWKQIRSIMRKAMDDAAETIDDVAAKRAFMDMSDLYSARSQILENIRAVSKTDQSVIGSVTKNYVKQALPLVGGSIAAGAVLN